MKHLFAFGLALLASLPICAQRAPGGATTQSAPGGGGTQPPAYVIPEETPWSHVADSMLQYVDKSQIPSGILYDRVIPYAALPYFDRFQSDTTSADHLRQAYLELFLAAYNRQAFAFTPTQLRETADALTRQGTVPLAVLDYRLHYLDTLAVYNNQLVLQNGLYHDVVGRNGSPYTERLLTLAAPLAQSVAQQAQFKIVSSLLLGNRGRSISNLVVDFDNGAGPVTCLPGQTVNVNYPTSGNKVVRFTVNFTTGASAQSRARLMVLASAPANRSVYRLSDFEARDPFTDYDGTRSLYGKGEALVVLNNAISESEGTAYKLRNPVIVMDGFDPNDESPLEVGDNSIYTLLEKKGILDLLTATQRDLVILNSPKSPRRQVSGGFTAENIDGGTDYVERNAYVLETLLNNLKPITHVEPSTGQRDKFVMLGPSMAGVISRYALAHMEKQQQLLADAGQPADPWWDHNTAEWISFDAPHMGANIPLADQHLLDFFRDKQSARDNLEQQLDAVVAKQFLVAHHTYTGSNVGGAPGYRDRFMMALRDNGERGSYGYPVHLRRVAVADGKLNGLLPPGNDGTPGGTMLDLNVYTRFWPGVAAAVISFFGFSYKTTSFTTIATCKARFLPSPNEPCLVFYGRTSETSGLSWGRYGPTAIRTVSVRGANQGSWDLAPGGFRTTQQQLHDQFEAVGNGENYKVSVTDLHSKHCFIPTVSALGFQYQSTANYQNTSSLPNPFTNLLTRGDLVCNNEVPFDAFYAPNATNSEHVTTDNDAVAFLIKELTPQVATPVFVQAPASACPIGGTFTFQVKQECVANRPSQQQSATTYNWTVTAGGTFAGNVQQLNGAGPTQAVTITPAPSNSIVDLSVTAVRAGAVPSTTVTRRIHITDAYANVTAPSEIAKFYTFTAALDQENTTGPYTWSISPQFKASILNPGTANGPSIQVRANNAGQITITATGTDACTGASFTAASATVTITTGGLRPAPARAAAYPNPADAVLHLAAPDATEAAAPARTAVLYNAQGREVRRSTALAATQLPTADLPSGLYYLLVEQQGKVSRSQIRVQH